MKTKEIQGGNKKQEKAVVRPFLAKWKINCLPQYLKGLQTKISSIAIWPSVPAFPGRFFLCG
jgi:hypothetical protein